MAQTQPQNAKAVNTATEVLTQIAQLATIRLDDAKLAKIVDKPTNGGLYPVHIQSSEDPTATVWVTNATPYIPEVNDECYVYCVDNNLSPATAFIIQIRGKDGNSLQKLFANQINEALANWTAPTSSTSSTSGPSIVDTWRPVQVNGASWKNKSTGSGALNFKAGTNISLSYSGNDLTISATGGSVTDTWRPVRVNGSQILTNDPTTGAFGVGIANGSEDILTLTTSTESWGKNAKLSIDIDGTYFDSNSDDGLTLQSSWVNTLATQTWVSNQHYLTQHQTVTNSGPTLAWGQTSTVGSIGGTALTVTMPSDPIPTLPQYEGEVIKYLGMGGYGWDFVAWSEIAGTPTIPTITLNGSTTTTPSFYAPTGGGSQGTVLRSGGVNQAPYWSNVEQTWRPFSYQSTSGSSVATINQTHRIVLAAGTNIGLNRVEDTTNKITTITFNVSSSPTPDPPAPCLIEGTEIRMADGSVKPIEEVRTGDEILSWDVNTNTFTTAFVISQSCNGRSLEFVSHLFDDGSYIVTFGVHMVYNKTKGYPIDIAEFNIGDITINAEGDEISYIGNNRYRVRRKDSVNYYALTTSNNLYFAGDILNGMTVFAKYRAADRLGFEIPVELQKVCAEQEQIIDDAAGYSKSGDYLREISPALKQKSILTKKIARAKENLALTDYMDNKHVEGCLSDEAWAQAVAERATYRAIINESEPLLEAAINQIEEIKKKYYKSTKGKRSRFKSFCRLDNEALPLYREWLAPKASN